MVRPPRRGPAPKRAPQRKVGESGNAVVGLLVRLARWQQATGRRERRKR